MESVRSSCLLNRRQRREVELIGGLLAQRGMRLARVVELDEVPDPRARVADRFVRMGIDFLMLDRAPQPLDKDVVPPAVARQTMLSLSSVAS